MKEIFLDIETSGIDPVKHSILSIGIVISLSGLDDYQSFYREIKYDELMIMPRAVEINHFDFSSQKNRMPLSQAEIEAVKFINKYYDKEHHPTAIGLNLAGFDLQFIKRQTPLLYQRLSHRSVDLNSLIYLYAEKHSKEFKEAKNELTQIAENQTKALGLGVEKHNALFDAVFNMNLYLLLKEKL
ncbi:MAG: 3'-5' exoribonuclease [Bacillus subtilis]|nr:3'-5' exoribonuclease [Bacillus subtilis]